MSPSVILVKSDWLEPLEGHYNIARFSAATFVLTVALLILHMWLPAGRIAGCDGEFSQPVSS